MSESSKRQTWSGRLAYILTVAGATVGFGATWRFPYLVGENGGGAYVLLFCVAMFVIGIPMILVENVIGRRKGMNALDAFGGTLNGRPVPKIWKTVGWAGLAGAFGIMAYYMVLGGWVISYIVNIIGGGLDISRPVDAAVTRAFFVGHIENSPLSIAFYTLLFVAANQWILVKGVIGGIEKAAKYLMPLLFVFLICMVVRNVTLPGAAEGIAFYLKPDFGKITPKLFVFVLGQVFFALSLGFGVMITLSSYLDKNEDLVQTAVITAITNTAIAVMAGFMIFPSLFSFGVAPDSGPTLVFQSLPIVFSNMWGGPVFAVIFFSLLLIAALTTSLTIYEVLITTVQEKTKIRRTAAITLVLAAIFLFGNIPSILGYGPWRGFTVAGRNLFDLFDYVSGNILFMLTALGSALFVGFVMKEEAKDELRYRDNRALVNAWFAYVKYIVPPVILLIFFSNLF